jgi:hypothetical protein
MPDIAKCSGEGCLDKQNCYRFTAKADEYQSYFMTPPIKDDGTCEYYWDNEEYPPEGVFHIKLEDDAIPES